MAKKVLKQGISKLQGGKCALTGQELPESTELFDTDRKTPKAAGGVYLVENTRVVDPVAHQKRHGTFREREEIFQDLKNKVGAREQTLKLRLKIENQIRAYARGVDKLDQDELDFLEAQVPAFLFREKKHTADLKRLVHELAKVDALVKGALGVRGVGEISIAYCLTYIDLSLADHASSLWAYAGLDKPSHKRYEKGVAGGGCKPLRTILYTMADAQVKNRGAYRPVYDRIKARLEISERIVESRNTQGKLVEVPWKDTKPCHRHGAALRAVMKHFLADYWMVGRTLAGLPTEALYPEAILGGGHKTIMPVERGWVY
jgi:hypothetical protein